MLNRDHQLDAEALLPGRSTEAGATRRTALQAALGLGYAAAAAPVMAQTAIATSAEGLVAGQVSYEVDGFKVPAYRAAPEGKTEWAANSTAPSVGSLWTMISSGRKPTTTSPVLL